jgi:hypothetical protein
MYKTFDAAHSEAVKQNLADGCVVRICAVIEKRIIPDGTGIEHYVSGYILSDWCDGSTIHTVS